MSDSVTATVDLQNSSGGTVLSFDGAPPVGAGYQLVTASEGELRRRRDVATSPYVHGAAEVASVLEEQRYDLVVLVVGSSTADVRSKREALIAAGTARRWRLSVTLDGQEEEWDCYAADVSIERPMAYLLSFREQVTLNIPVSRRT